MSSIDVKSSGANSFFFTIWGIDPLPRMVHAAGRRRPIFFADNHLGRDARFTSVGIERKMPHWQGMGLAIGSVDSWHNVQSERRKLTRCSNPRPLSGVLFIPSGDYWENAVFSGRFMRQSFFCSAISDTISFFRGNI
jgi:hypothetical protein